MSTIEISDLTAALRAVDIEYRIEHPGTEIATVQVARTDGQAVAFGPGTDEFGARTGDGIDVAYYIGDVDTDVRTQDWVPTTDQLIADLTKFLA